METVEVANKELKVETRLRNIEDRWKEEQLRFTRHRDTNVGSPPTRTGYLGRRAHETYALLAWDQPI